VYPVCSLNQHTCARAITCHRTRRLPGKDRSTEVRATEITVCDRRRTEKHRRGRGVASRESRRESYGDVELEEVERTIVEPHRLIDDNEGGRMRTLREIIVHYSLAPIGSGIIYMKRRKDADERVLPATGAQWYTQVCVTAVSVRARYERKRERERERESTVSLNRVAASR